MTSILRLVAALLLPLAALFTSPAAVAAPAAAEIGIVIMHGKGGRPDKFVGELADALELDGFLVANLEMPWSGRRQYDTTMQGAADEITAALAQLRSRGARKIFVGGHSQGGLFAVHYGSMQRVDGIIAIVPGGMVDAAAFVDALREHVAKAKQMIAEGRGNEKSSFADYEGSRGTNTITTTAAIYHDWFNPDGAHSSRAFGKVIAGTPVLYIAPTRDYPGLSRSKQKNFNALPSHPLTRMVQPESDHLNSPGAGSAAIGQWLLEVAAQ